MAAIALASACGGASGKGQCSTVGQVECVTDSLSRVCGADNQWVALPCTEDQTCMAMGSGCVAKTDISCNATDSGCVDSTHAVVCNSTGMGFQAVTCPTGTTCQGYGTCVGTCIVGSSTCNGPDIAQTCTDGFTYTDTYCMPGMTSCVLTDPTAPVPKAGCVAQTCSPGATACGNKASSATDTDPNYASSCQASPSGYHWQSEKCALANSCVLGQCSATCTPGETRCTATTQMETCQADGTWANPVGCQPTATGVEQVCYNGPNGAACGDSLCAAGWDGTCLADGFHPCVDGKISESMVACTIGRCQQVNTSNYDGYHPGTCQIECNPGDTKCNGSEAYQTCGADYLWGQTNTACTTGSCQEFHDSSGDSKTVCGVCVPGTHRCTDSAGTSPPSGAPTDIETCDNTGQWSAHAGCTIGQCGYNGLDYACIAQCVPNSTICMGSSPATCPNPEHCGTTQYGQCSANGILPTTGTTCPNANTSCRKGQNGQPVGSGAAACVTCVGPNIPGGNESGLVDTYCGVGSTASSTQLETCTASNTWGTAQTCPGTPAQGLCQNESTTSGSVVPVCGPGFNYPYCSQSYLFYNFGSFYTCDYWWGWYGNTETTSWGAYGDCCNVPSCTGQYGTNSTVSPAVCY